MLVKGWSSPLILDPCQLPDVGIRLAGEFEETSQALAEVVEIQYPSQSQEENPTLQSNVTLRKLLSIQAGYHSEKSVKMRPASITLWYFTLSCSAEQETGVGSHQISKSGENNYLQANEESLSGSFRGCNRQADVELNRVTIYLEESEPDIIKLADELRKKFLRNSCLQKPILFVYNPNAGPGNREAFNWTINHVLGRGHQVQILQTTKAGDAMEQIQRVTEAGELDRYYCVCIWGGDGTIHEVIQGYYNSWQNTMTKSDMVPLHLAAFPGGSASALLYTALLKRGLKLNLTNALYSFCWSTAAIKVPLYSFTLDEGTHRGILFLSVLAGFLADVDFESEVLRCLGALRFDLYGAFKCLFPKVLQVTRLTLDGNPVTLDRAEHYSLALLALPSITPSFHFENCGLSLLSKSNSLVKWLLQSVRSVKPADGKINVEFAESTVLSIDGEAYSAKRIELERTGTSGPDIRLFN